jgi:hypothetical protein
MRACRCTMQAIARRYSTTVRIGCAPPPFAPRKHGARRQHTHMHAHNPTYRCEQPRTQVKRRGGCEPGARQESRWTAAEGPRQTVGAARVHVCGSCHVNSTREDIRTYTHRGVTLEQDVRAAAWQRAQHPELQRRLGLRA